MKTNHPITFLLAGVFLLPGMISAATYSVFSGQSIQAKIDGATNGDTVAIFGGTYTENLTISNKDVRLQLVSGQNVTLAGNITFSGLSNAYTFANFTWGGQTDKRITVNNCSNFTINGIKSAAGSIDSTGTGNLLINATALTNGYIGVTSSTNTKVIDTSVSGVMNLAGGTKVQVIRSTNGGGTAVSSQVDFIRSTVNGNYTSSGTKMPDNVTPSRLSFSRCTVTESLDSTSGLTYVSYSTLRWFRQRYDGKAYLVGNTINERRARGGSTIELFDTAFVAIFNNIIRDGAADDYWSYDGGDNHGVTISASARVVSLNNIIYNYSSHRYGDRGFRLLGSATITVTLTVTETPDLTQTTTPTLTLSLTNTTTSTSTPTNTVTSTDLS